jgi:hypothetical protein
MPSMLRICSAGVLPRRSKSKTPKGFSAAEKEADIERNAMIEKRVFMLILDSLANGDDCGKGR